MPYKSALPAAATAKSRSLSVAASIVSGLPSGFSAHSHEIECVLAVVDVHENEGSDIGSSKRRDQDTTQLKKTTGLNDAAEMRAA
jgi:hypothetical protein